MYKTMFQIQNDMQTKSLQIILLELDAVECTSPAQPFRVCKLDA